LATARSSFMLIIATVIRLPIASNSFLRGALDSPLRICVQTMRSIVKTDFQNV
jgi:hypothetical protein